MISTIMIGALARRARNVSREIRDGADTADFRAAFEDELKQWQSPHMTFTSDQLYELIACAKRNWVGVDIKTCEIACERYIDEFGDIHPNAIVFTADCGTSQILWRLDGDHQIFDEKGIL